MAKYGYGTQRGVKILDEGEIDGYQYVIINLGTHKVAYVGVKKEHPFYEKKYYEMDVDIEVHGGLTFSGYAYWNESKEVWYLGWDYTHMGDYNSSLPALGGKKWTVEEILLDVEIAVEQIKKRP